MIAENIKTIQQKIKETCEEVKRDPNEVKVVAVTKTFSSQKIIEAYSAGITDFAENYAQEFVEKHKELAQIPIRWHFIGHLQTNKIKYIAGKVELIHSVDSIKLAKEISDFCGKKNITQDVLIEINTSGENKKFGFRPEDVYKAVSEILKLKNINMIGLMTIGKFSEDPEESRSEFKLLRELRDELKQKGFDLNHLSMGMSNDFQVAIQEGATILRIGSAIFGARVYNN